MSGYNLGEARGRIVLETDFSSLAEAQAALGEFQSGAARSASELDKTSKSAIGTKEAFSNVATGAGVAGGVIAGGFLVAVKSAADFEQGLSEIQATSGATTGEMDKIHDAALRIGKDTSFSATEAASAMSELSKAGVSVHDILNGAADATVALAAAGGVDLPEAATIASNAMNQFGLTAQELPNIADKIAGAANASAIDVSDFGYSLSQVGAVAKLAGVNFDDTATAIAVMGNAGIKGSDAGTSLKTMLMNLSPQTKKAKEEMMDLGIITADGSNKFYDAQGKLKSLSEISGILQDSLKGLTNEQKQNALATLFGSDAIRGAAVLAGQGSEGFDKMAASIAKVKAADVAKVRMDNMKGSIQALSGSAETLAITIGEKIVPVLTKMIDGISKAVDAFINMDAGQRNALVAAAAITGGLLLLVAATIKTVQAIQATVATFRAIAAVVGGARAVMAGYAAASYGSAAATYAQTVAGKLGVLAFKAQQVAVKAATAAQWLFNAALDANPIGLIIIAIAAVVAALVYFFTQTKLGREIWANFVQFLQEAWTNIVAFATTAWGGIADFFTSLWTGIQQGVATAWGAIVSFFTTVFQTLLNLFLNFTPLGIFISHFSQIRDFVAAVFTAILTTITTVMTNISSFLATVLAAIVTFFQPLTDFIVQNVFPVFQAFGELVAAVFNYISQLTQAVWSAVIAFLVGVFNNIAAAFTANFNLFRDIVTTVFNAVSSFISAVWNAILSFLTAVITNIVNNAKANFTLMQQVVTTIFNAVKSVITSVWNAIYSFVAPIVQRIVSVIQSTLNTAIGIVTSIFNSVRNAIQSAFNAVVSIVSGIVNNVRNTIDAGFNALVGIVRTIFGNVTGAARSQLEAMVSAVSSVKDRVIGVFSGAGSWLANAGRMIIDGLINGIKAALGGLTSLLHSVTAMIPANKGPESVDKKLLTPNGELIMKGLMNGIANRYPDLQAQLQGLTASIPDDVQATVDSNVRANVSTRSASSGRTVELTVNWYAARGDSKAQVLDMLGRSIKTIEDEED